MECAGYFADLSAYLDDELAPSRRRALEEHLRICRQCAGELRSLGGTGAFVEEHLRELEPSDALWDRVQSRILSQPEPAARFSAWWNFLTGRRWLAAAATLICLAALGLGVHSYLSREASEEELVKYMSEYIQLRESEQKRIRELGASAPSSAAKLNGARSEMGYNPFAARESATTDNPFRSEEQ